jgi:RNA polymerase sigma-70 factor (ECF subfamily)
MEDIHHHRPLLFSLAYHILGEVQEAEDIVQDVFESWFSKRPDVQFAKAYLSRAVVNRAFDRLEGLKKAREVYKGVWLPVPVISETPSREETLPDPLPYAMLSLLEKLNPVERAAFILRQAFDTSYEEIAEICTMTEDNARQLVHRAHEKLQRPRVRYEVSVEERQRLLNAFLYAAASSDISTLKALLHQDVIMYSDGGGKVAAAMVPIYGPDKIITFLTNVLKGAAEIFDLKLVTVNGSPGALISNKETGAPDTVFTIETDGHTITGLYFVRNPEKIIL